MKIRVRTEKISDYSKITEINYEAFLGWHPENMHVTEPLLVDFLRHNSMFDPELSLVAEIDGEICGHVLFSPFKFIVLGKEELGVVLAPIAVLPKYQKTGIGKMLIEEGHRRAFEKGYTFSLLCGHTSYYPKFGYKTGMFSESGVMVSMSMNNFNPEYFVERPVNSKDVPWITDIWSRIHHGDRLALFPGSNIGDWSNHGQSCRCNIVLRKDNPIGYIRYSKTNPVDVKELLAANEDILDILFYLLYKNYDKAEGEMIISIDAEKLYPFVSNSHVKVQDINKAHNAFMIKVLNERKGNISEYCNQVENKKTRPGIIVHPSMFDVC